MGLIVGSMRRKANDSALPARWQSNACWAPKPELSTLNQGIQRLTGKIWPTLKIPSKRSSRASYQLYRYPINFMKVT